MGKVSSRRASRDDEAHHRDAPEASPTSRRGVNHQHGPPRSLVEVPLLAWSHPRASVPGTLKMLMALSLPPTLPRRKAELLGLNPPAEAMTRPSMAFRIPGARMMGRRRNGTVMK